MRTGSTVSPARMVGHPGVTTPAVSAADKPSPLLQRLRCTTAETWPRNGKIRALHQLGPIAGWPTAAIVDHDRPPRAARLIGHRTSWGERRRGRQVSQPSLPPAKGHKCALEVTMDVKVTKCPPGVALGAGDLHQWASRRRSGSSGVSNGAGEQCSTCGRELLRSSSKRTKRRLGTRCGQCGKWLRS